MLPGFYVTLFFGQPYAFVAGALLGYMGALLIGGPMLVLLVRRQWLRWWQLGLAGALSAVPAVLFYMQRGDPENFEPFDLAHAAIVLVWGAFAGWCFWLLAVCGNSPLDMRAFGLRGHADPDQD
jgi:hypothetical protein